MDQPWVSVIIPVRTINDYIRKETVPRILAQTYLKFEIIILPDKKSKEKFSKTKIIPTWPKTGPADKRNIGAKKAKGEILAFLDDDSYPDKNWLKNAVRVFQSAISNQQSAISAVCGPALTPPNEKLRQKAGGYVWSTWMGSGGAGIYRSKVDKKREVDDFPSVNLLVRKKDFFKVDGFGSRFWPGEDTSLCYDLVYKLGKKIIYDPKVLVYHHRREVFRPHLQQISRYAVHRGYFARVLPKTSLRIGFLIPTFFVLGLIGGPLLFLLLKLFNFCSMASFSLFLYLFIILIYLAGLFLTSFYAYRKEKNFKLALLIIPTIFLTHLFYGILLVKGFLAKDLAIKKH